MTPLTGKVGFASPTTEQNFSKRRYAGIELLATVALAISLIIAATAVSIGMARAQAIGAVSHGDGGPFAIAVFVGLLMAGMGALTAMAARGQSEGDCTLRRVPIRQTHACPLRDPAPGKLPNKMAD